MAKTKVIEPVDIEDHKRLEKRVIRLERALREAIDGELETAYCILMEPYD